MYNSMGFFVCYVIVFLIVEKIYNTKFSTLTVLRVQSSGISYIHSAVLPLPVSVFKALSSPQTEIP